MPVPAPPPSDGVPDSIWIDLGYPVGVARRQLGRTGLSNEAVEELLAARPILSGEDREILARIVTGLNTRSES